MKVITVRPNGTRRVQTIIEGADKTDQSFAKECDINEIVRKFTKTGVLPIKTQGRYDDVSNRPDYVTALQTVINAQNEFQELPAHIRKRFNNSPEHLMSFLSDPKNTKEAIEIGLLTKVVPETDPLLEEVKNLNKNLSSNIKSKEKKTTNSNDE